MAEEEDRKDNPGSSFVYLKREFRAISHLKASRRTDGNVYGRGWLFQFPIAGSAAGIRQYDRRTKRMPVYGFCPGWGCRRGTPDVSLNSFFIV